MSKGKKLDQGKAPVVQGCFHYFPRALIAIAMISLYGGTKYDVALTEKNWKELYDRFNRYTDADGRHLLGDAIDGPYDPESHYLHAAHHAWDALARLEIMLEDGIPLNDN